MSVEPGIAGFEEAQRRLRDKVGMDVTLLTPTATAYPPGTVLDPERGTPYDPTIEPTASGMASATVRADVVYRPLTGAGEDQATITEVGIWGQDDVAISIHHSDWPLASGATEFEVLGRRFEVRDNQVIEGLQNEENRIIFGEGRS